MKKLVLASLLCGGLAHMASGCVVVAVEDEGTIAATWSLVGGDLHTPVACPPNATTVEIITQDAYNDQIVDQFDCLDAATAIVYRHPGSYDAWLRLTDTSAYYTYAMSRSVRVDVSAGYETPLNLERVSVDRGSFALTWEVLYDGYESDCYEAGASDVSVVSTLVGTEGTFYDDEQDCEVGGMETPAMVLGDYVVSVALIDEETGGALYTAPAIESSLDYGNHFRNLGHFYLDYALD